MTKEEISRVKAEAQGLSMFSLNMPEGKRLMSKGWVDVGPHGQNQLILTIGGINLQGDPSSAVIHLQPRAQENSDDKFYTDLNDQWLTRVLKVEPNSLVVLIKRMDASTGWQMRLRLDMLIME